MWWWWVLQFKILKRDPKTERSQQQTEQQRKAAQQSQLSNKTVRLRFATVPTPATFEPRSHSSMSCIFELTYKVAVVPAPPPLPNVAHNTTLWGVGVYWWNVGVAACRKAGRVRYCTGSDHGVNRRAGRGSSKVPYSRIPPFALFNVPRTRAPHPPPRARASAFPGNAVFGAGWYPVPRQL